MKQKTAFIVVLYKTPESEVDRLTQEIPTENVYFIDNTETGEGYAAGVNKAIKQALEDGMEHLFIANPDISLSKIEFDHLLAPAEHFDVWGFSFQQDGKTYYGGKIDYWTMAGGLSTQKPEKRFHPVDFVSGSLMGIKRQVIEKIGLFDELYGMYYEDVDYSVRARQAGFKVGIDAGVEYKHFETSNSDKKKKWFLTKNRFRFLKKYGSVKHKIMELIRLPLTIYRYFAS